MRQRKNSFVFEELKDTIYTVFAYLYSKGLLHYDIKVDNVITYVRFENIRFAVLDFDLCSPIREKSHDSAIVRGHMDTKSVQKYLGRSSRFTTSRAIRTCLFSKITTLPRGTRIQKHHIFQKRRELRSPEHRAPPTNRGKRLAQSQTRNL